MRESSSLLVLVLAASCSQQAPSASDAEYLKTVVACFHHSIQELQAEPEPDTAIGPFLMKAIASWKARDPNAMPTEMSRLVFSESDGRLLTPRGEAVKCEMVSSEHDSWADGSSSYTNEYVFTTPGGAKELTTVVQKFGIGPDGDE